MSERFLRRAVDGLMFTYTDLLAKQPGFVPVDADGNLVVVAPAPQTPAAIPLPDPPIVPRTPPPSVNVTVPTAPLKPGRRNNLGI